MTKKNSRNFVNKLAALQHSTRSNMKTLVWATCNYESKLCNTSNQIDSRLIFIIGNHMYRTFRFHIFTIDLNIILKTWQWTIIHKKFMLLLKHIVGYMHTYKDLQKCIFQGNLRLLYSNFTPACPITLHQETFIEQYYRRYALLSTIYPKN